MPLAISRVSAPHWKRSSRACPGVVANGCTDRANARFAIEESTARRLLGATAASEASLGCVGQTPGRSLLKLVDELEHGVLRRSRLETFVSTEPSAMPSLVRCRLDCDGDAQSRRSALDHGLEILSDTRARSCGISSCTGSLLGPSTVCSLPSRLH